MAITTKIPGDYKFIAYVLITIVFGIAVIIFVTPLIFNEKRRFEQERRLKEEIEALKGNNSNLFVLTFNICTIR